MNYEKARARVAELLGFKFTPATGDPDNRWDCNTWRDRNGAIRHSHPVPATLDGIAALWNEHAKGWNICVKGSFSGKTWWATATHPDWEGGSCNSEASTELEARTALLARVLETQAKEKTQ